jgi:hypothetical protein
MKGGFPSRLSTELYRERTATSLPYSLRRKRCACTKVVTAKQLQQHGACEACVRAAPTNDIQAAE